MVIFFQCGFDKIDRLVAPEGLKHWQIYRDPPKPWDPRCIGISSQIGKCIGTDPPKGAYNPSSPPLYAAHHRARRTAAPNS